MACRPARAPSPTLWLSLFLIGCAAPKSEPAVHPPARPQKGSATWIRDAGLSRPSQDAAPLPAPDFARLLEEVAAQLVGPGLTLPGALWAQLVPNTAAPAPVAERLLAALQRRGRSVASSAAEAEAVVVLLPTVQLDVVEGRRSRTLALLAMVVAPHTGELLALRGSRESIRMDDTAGAGAATAAASHPTAAELLDLASDVGQVLRDKLRQLSLPPAGVVLEVQPVRNQTGQVIQADLAAMWILKAIGTVPKVRAVLGSRRWGMTPPPATALQATHVLKADLSSSGGRGRSSRLAIHLTARLVPLISTNAALLDADATLLPPLVPDAQ
jgi:hypothetical protein